MAGAGLTAGDKGTLGMVLRTRGLPRLEELWLPNCGLGDAGVCALCDALHGPGAAPALRHVELDGNHAGYAGAAALAAAMHRGALPCLETLFFGRNPHVGNDGAAVLAPELRRARALERFDLNSCGIGDEGAAALLGTCARGDFAAVVSVDLVGNALTDAGATTVATAVAAGALPKLASPPQPQLRQRHERRGAGAGLPGGRIGTGRGCSLLRSRADSPPHGARVPRARRPPPPPFSLRACHVWVVVSAALCVVFFFLLVGRPSRCGRGRHARPQWRRPHRAPPRQHQGRPPGQAAVAVFFTWADFAAWRGWVLTLLARGDARLHAVVDGLPAGLLPRLGRWFGVTATLRRRGASPPRGLAAPRGGGGCSEDPCGRGSRWSRRRRTTLCGHDGGAPTASWPCATSSSATTRPCTPGCTSTTSTRASRKRWAWLRGGDLLYASALLFALLDVRYMTVCESIDIRASIEVAARAARPRYFYYDKTLLVPAQSVQWDHDFEWEGEGSDSVAVEPSRLLPVPGRDAASMRGCWLWDKGAAWPARPPPFPRQRSLRPETRGVVSWDPPHRGPHSDCSHGSATLPSVRNRARSPWGTE